MNGKVIRDGYAVDAVLFGQFPNLHAMQVGDRLKAKISIAHDDK
ncbi:hypothetical protein ARTSIC4J27_1814 [Pseudarthrobacter siccitolerans]|uniref:Uncharacterized protein n=1 Tax=Pseudarthrobacter siccitolerans TaxID=861266 RepID=A0A024H288_9MICC|nr:hypothetical protein ARTSIC4J27_1814 [Pseudarthrobacter siccitolerans]